MKSKKFLAVLLSLIMVFGILPTAVLASTENGSTYDDGGTIPEFSDTIYPATRTDLRDESIYYLIITRFYDGDSSNNVHCWDDGSAGNPDSDPAWRGDFKGLIEKLDYIKALGFTAVQLFPVAQNASGYDYHGYHTINMKRIDPRFESEGYTYQDLVDACHERDLKVIQEINLNSTSNFGEENLCKLFEVNEDADLSNLKEALTPTKTLLDTYGLSSAGEYWSQSGGTQYSQRLNIMKNTEYTSDNTNSTGSLPDAKDYAIGKMSSSDKYNANNYFHSGYFQILNWDDWTCKFSQITGDSVDLNTENPAVAKYLVEACKMYVDMGVDAFVMVNARHIDRLTLNVQFVEQIKDLFRAKGKEPAIFLDVVTRYKDVWNRETATESAPYYTWKESDSKWAEQWSWGTSIEDVNNNMNLVFDHTIEEVDISDEPTSDNAFLDGIVYHNPDYSMAGANVNDFTMHRLFGSASSAYNVALEGDRYYNDSTWNITFVDSYDYSPESPSDSSVFSGGTDAWKENLCLMFTFRGIPRVTAGTEVEFQKGEQVDKGTLLPLSQTRRAYYGDYLEGNVTTGNFSDYTASGTVADTLDSTLSKHIQKLNAIRKAVPALRKGQYTASSDYVTGDMAFIRRYTNADECVDSLALVTITNAAEFKNIPNGEYVDAVTGDVQYVTDGTLSVEAPGKGDMRVYVCQAEGFTGLTAEFDVTAYTLSFDGNGTEGQTESIISSAVGYVTLPKCTFTAPEGKVFKAWEVNGVEYSAGVRVKITSDTTAKAVWRDIECYGLSLGDTVVSEINKDNILGDGTACYNPDTFTLTLNGYKDKGITTSLDNLNIVLSEKSENFISSDSCGIYSDGGTITVSGDASLMIFAGETAISADIVNLSGNTITAIGKINAITAKNGDISITGGILNVLGKTESAINAGGSINISDAYVTAVSYNGTALSVTPVLDGYTKSYKAVAGIKANGGNAGEYVSGDNGLYKYFRINPYYNACFMSEDGESTLYNIETQSGIIKLPEFSVIGADEGSYEYWSGNGKYYLPGAKLAIDADTEFSPVSEGGTPVDDNAIYMQNDAGWSKVYAFYFADGNHPVGWPGVIMENIKNTNIWKITDIPSGFNKIIFHAGNGASQTSDLLIPTDGKNMFINSTNIWTSYNDGIKTEDTSEVNIVSFSAGSGMGYMNELLIKDGEFTLPECMMIYPEYVNAFEAWSIGEEKYQPGDVITISEDTVIMAAWDSSLEAVISGDGAGNSHTIGSDTDITITGTGELEKFECVKLDGSVVEKDSYTVEEGSTIITLKATYLDTLFVGNHTIEIVWTYGSAFTDITIVAGAAKPCWKKNETGWWYDNGDGTYPKSTWKSIDGSWYYFNASGYIVTGWFADGGNWYYLESNGKMATGWKCIDGKWYYLESNGKMAANKWVDSVYYVKSNGVMATNEWVDGEKYYVGADGKWVPNKTKAGWKKNATGWWYDNGDGTYPKSTWKSIDGSWYYFNASGYIVTGWFKDGGKWYYLESNGKMAANKWVDSVYYVKSNGVMAVSEWVDGNRYYVGADGKWVPGKTA